MVFEMEQPVSVPKPLRLTNAPIVEAVIGVNIPRLSEGILEQFKTLSEHLAQWDYSGPFPVTESNFRLTIKEGQSSVVNQDFLFGWRFENKIKQQSVQFKVDGFTFSRLGNYETWEQFRAEAKGMWDLYFGVTGPTELSEYGVRYINKVHIPEGEEISDYLTVYPVLPANMPQNILNSFIRFGLALTEPQGLFTHQQIVLPPEKPGYVTVIIDNDFKFSAIGLSEKKLWEQLEQVRQIKDDYFCKMITNKLLETFNV